MASNTVNQGPNDSEPDRNAVSDYSSGRTSDSEVSPKSLPSVPRVWLHDFVGSPVLLQLVRYQLNRCLDTRKPCPHYVFSGSRGVGKKTLAQMIARELGTEFQMGDCRKLRTLKDFLHLLTNAGYGSVLLLSNVEALNSSSARFLEPAITDFSVDITLDEGDSTRTINMKLQPFTFVGTTERVKKVPAFLRTAATILEFGPVPPSEMANHICRHIKRFPHSMALTIVEECNPSPGEAVQIAQRLIDYGYAVANGRLSRTIIRQAMSDLGILKRSITMDSDCQTSRSVWRNLRGVAFEAYLAESLSKLGFGVRSTPTTGDHGVDLVATRGNFRLAIQAKGYAGSVGNDAVQQVYTGMKYYDCNACAVITNSSFTPQAYEIARKVNCSLVAENELSSFLRGEFDLQYTGAKQ